MYENLKKTEGGEGEIDVGFEMKTLPSNPYGKGARVFLGHWCCESTRFWEKCPHFKFRPRFSKGATGRENSSEK
jgi:hypothetical protein